MQPEQPPEEEELPLLEDDEDDDDDDAAELDAPPLEDDMADAEELDTLVAEEACPDEELADVAEAVLEEELAALEEEPDELLDVVALLEDAAVPELLLLPGLSRGSAHRPSLLHTWSFRHSSSEAQANGVVQAAMHEMPAAAITVHVQVRKRVMSNSLLAVGY